MDETLGTTTDGNQAKTYNIKVMKNVIQGWHEIVCLKCWNKVSYVEVKDIEFEMPGCSKALTIIADPKISET